jgi:carboxyl-terminal processing protease
MSTRSRSLLALAIVAVAAWGGAAYAGRIVPQTSIAAPPTLSLDVASLVSRGDADRRVIQVAYEQVEHAYYQPVDPQRLMDGETKALNAYLSAKNVHGSPVARPHATGDQARDLQTIERTVDTVANRYHNVASKSVFTEVAVTGMLGGLGDPYTTYLSANEIRALDEQLKGGDFGGIGVYIVQDPKTKAILVDPIEGNPAIRAGVRTGDSIVAVDDHATAGQPLDAVEREIRGPKGTVVSLRLKRHSGNVEQTVRIVRADVHVPSVRAKIEDGFDYVRLADFGNTSADEVRTAFQRGKRAGVHGYILDLRNNGGGLLDAAVDISSLVIPNGAIVSTIDRAGNRDVRSATGRAIDPTPLVVLVNKYTASASEITAGALQDYHAATILGTKTFGKGVVQSLYQLPDAGALKITTARYVTPHGRDIQHRGIVPDVVVDQPVDRPIIDTPDDKQLAAAKALLRKKETP